jgi:hypothetical protein
MSIRHYPARTGIRVRQSLVFLLDAAAYPRAQAGRVRVNPALGRASGVPNVAWACGKAASEAVPCCRCATFLSDHRPRCSTRCIGSIYNHQAMPQCVEARHNTKHAIRTRARERHRQAPFAALRCTMRRPPNRAAVRGFLANKRLT